MSDTARQFIVRGRVQGVGFRAFVQKYALMLKLRGYARNMDDGSVEVYAVGPAGAIEELAGYLWKGPMLSDVRGVEQTEAAPKKLDGFRIQ